MAKNWKKQYRYAVCKCHNWIKSLYTDNKHKIANQIQTNKHSIRMRLKKRKKQCLFHSLRFPCLGLLSIPWTLTRLQSHDWAGEESAVRPGALNGAPLKPVLSALPWLGPYNLVHAMVAWTSGREDPGKVTLLQVRWCWGPQLKPLFWECSLLGTSAGSGAPGWDESETEGEVLRGSSSETGLACLLRHVTLLIHSPGSQFPQCQLACHFLLQGIFLTQGSNPSLPHWGQTLYRLSHQGIPKNQSWHETVLPPCGHYLKLQLEHR